MGMKVRDVRGKVCLRHDAADNSVTRRNLMSSNYYLVLFGPSGHMAFAFTPF